ncbi:MAG: hypothetical protein IIB19_04760 [Chloroflexi bacterium]|nr:hypothetical protein [Chloroflexota bacterium]
MLFMLPVALFAISGTAAAQETVSVAVGDIWFCDASFQGGVCDTVIDVGDTVVWDFNDAQLPHTATACGDSCDTPTSSPAWDSGFIAGGGGTYEYTFTEPGTYLYLCEIHPFTMRGQIIVQGGPPPTTAPPTPVTAATATPGDGTSPTSTPVATTTIGSPITGAGPQEGSSGAWWTPAALAATGGALVALGGGWHARRRRLQIGSRDDG